MKTLEAVASRLAPTDPEDRDLVFAFFASFSLFECALKRSGHVGGRRGAAPDWEAFATSLNGRLTALVEPRVVHARQFLLSAPPKTQVVNATSLSWAVTEPKADESADAFLLRLVRTVRNNLFHGGKYPYPAGPVLEAARDRDLLRASLTILNACVTLVPALLASFEDAA